MTEDPGLSAALAALRARAHELPLLTRRLVEVNSYTANVAGVNATGELLREALALPSLSVEARAGERYGTSLFWRTPAAQAGGAAILLIGHHDTVFPPDHFEGWREEGGWAVGPGALDMKGGLAVIRAALAALDDVGELAGLPVVVASVADEEVGSPESRPHLEATARGAACALVFESGRPKDTIVTRRRGTGGLRVAAIGRPAHAGNALSDGANAIWALARFVDAAQRLSDFGRGLTVSVGLIGGGTSRNTVPASAACDVDLRFETAADAEALLMALRAAADDAARAVPGTRLTVEGGVNRAPLVRTEASAALYREYSACQRAAGLGDGEEPIVGGGSDASTVSPLGVPAIDGLGPRGVGYHTSSERVDLASFLPKAEALVRFLWGRRSVRPQARDSD